MYVTFGSRVTPPPHLVRTVAQGLVAGGWAVVWSLKDANASHLPSGELIKEGSVRRFLLKATLKPFTVTSRTTTRILPLVFIPHEFSFTFITQALRSMDLCESHFCLARGTDRSPYCFLTQLFMPLESSSFAHGYRRGPRSLTHTSRQRYVRVFM